MKKRHSEYKSIIDTTFAVIAIVVVINITFFIWGRNDLLNDKLSIDLQAFDAFGSIMGGILGPTLSLISFYLIIKSIEKQQQFFERSHSLNQFLEMIKFFRDRSDQKGEEIFGEKQYIEQITLNFKYLFIYLKTIYHQETGTPLFEKIETHVINGTRKELVEDDDYLQSIKVLTEYTYILLQTGFKPRNINWSKKVSYTIWLDEGNDKMKENKRILKNIALNISTNPNPFYAWIGKYSKTGDKDVTDKVKEFFQMNKRVFFKLYYPLLIQLVKFVGDQTPYKYEIENNRYIKIIRGQLTEHEQNLLFLNSLTTYGRDWEFVYRGRGANHGGLITRYHLINNISFDYFEELGINPKVIYAKVEFSEYHG